MCSVWNQCDPILKPDFSNFPKVSNKIIVSNNINHTMSDPTNQTYVSTSNQGNAPVAPAVPSVLSYFNTANATKEFNAELPELILVFASSVAISRYMNDSWKTASARGGIMAVGQYVGGYVSDALASAQYFNTASMAKYSPYAVKFVLASGAFIAGCRYLGSTQPLSNLLGESLIASIIADTGAPYIANSVANAEASTGSYF